jgi:hypothetical protein
MAGHVLLCMLGLIFISSGQARPDAPWQKVSITEISIKTTALHCIFRTIPLCKTFLTAFVKENNDLAHKVLHQDPDKDRHHDYDHLSHSSFY